MVLGCIGNSVASTPHNIFLSLSTIKSKKKCKYFAQQRTPYFNYYLLCTLVSMLYSQLPTTYETTDTLRNTRFSAYPTRSVTTFTLSARMNQLSSLEGSSIDKKIFSAPMLCQQESSSQSHQPAFMRCHEVIEPVLHIPTKPRNHKFSQRCEPRAKIEACYALSQKWPGISRLRKKTLQLRAQPHSSAELGMPFSNARAQFLPGGLGGLSVVVRLRAILKVSEGRCFMRTGRSRSAICNRNSTTAFSSEGVRYCWLCAFSPWSVGPDHEHGGECVRRCHVLLGHDTYHARQEVRVVPTLGWLGP